LKIEGWASTTAIDRDNEIVESIAFESSLPDYLKNPILLYMHDWYGMPIGKIVSAEIKDEGLWVAALVLPTEYSGGADAIMLIKESVLKFFSIGFRVKEYIERPDDDEPSRITDLELMEISIVHTPANPFAEFSALKSLGVETLTVGKSYQEKRINIMPKKNGDENPDLIKEIQDNVDDVTVQVSDLKKETVANMVKLSAQIKEVKDRSDADVIERIDNIEADFQKMIDKYNQEFEDIKKRKPTSYADNKGGTFPTFRKALEMPERELKYLCTDGEFNRLELLREKHDDIILIDALLEASAQNPGGGKGIYAGWHTMNRAARIKSLKAWEEFEGFAKAMYSTYSGYGDEWVPTDLSSQLYERLKQDYKLAALFAEVAMPTNPFEIPTDGDDTEAVIAAEQTTVITALADSTEQTPATAKVTFTAEKLRARYQVTTELTEDAAFAILPFCRGKIVRSINKAFDQGIMNGQETGDIDTGYGGIAATSAKKICDGLRYNTQAGVKIDCSAFTEANLRDIRAGMDIFGEDPLDLAWLCSLKCYLKHFLKDLDNVQTIDKYGPNATIVKGELAKFDAISINTTGMCQNDLNASGIYDAVTTNKTAVTLVHRPSFRIGTIGGIRVFVHFNPFYDVWSVIAFKRFDFQPMEVVASKYIVNEGYGIDAA
jgi:HK97 family phage prohead protease/HK97 family phage major capsid protein